MHLHEYQAKTILRQYGIPLPDFRVISSLSELPQAVEQLSVDKAVVKVQVHAGGRGKAGGVKVAQNRDQMRTYVEQLLNMKIINKQTGPQGMVSHQLLITPVVAIKKEYYLAAVLDTETASGVLVASPEGGMEIEEIAAKNPRKILKMPISNNGIVHPFHIRQLIKFMGWSWEKIPEITQLIGNLARAFVATDSSLLEINPLIETDRGELVALDVKMTIDDNALFRQKALAAFYDPTQITLAEANAKEYDLAYVAMEGNIGCMVNGAGLAMATMDIIQHYHGKPANFLDVGGGASQEKITEGFQLILKDPKVKAVLVNIFGGIMNCETVASGLLAAASAGTLRVPLIVRMEGTNVEKGKQLLRDSGLNIITANSLDEAAKLSVEAVGDQV